MKTTWYFENRVVGDRRPYLQREWCEAVLANPVKEELQEDGRFRFWGFVPEIGKYLRVVTLEDRETVLNAFPDRSFKP